MKIPTCADSAACLTSLALCGAAPNMRSAGSAAIHLATEPLRPRETRERSSWPWYEDALYPSKGAASCLS